jgi:serine/threonine protein kinase
MSEPRRRFTIGPCLGHGGSGEVYRAVMRSPGGLETEVAVKVLRQGVSSAGDAVRRLRDEGRVLARLNHPAILKVHDLVLLDERVALVTEWIDGQDLSDCIAGADAMGPRAVLQAIGAVADALHAAREAPGPDGVKLELVHRDVKPANIRIGRHGDVKVLDYGIARSDVLPREAFTVGKALAGSPGYVAPERYQTDSRAGPPSDVFSLGCTLYHALVHAPFFAGASRDVARLCVDRGPFEAHLAAQMAKVPTELPAEVVALLRSMVDYSPVARPDAEAVARATERLADAMDGPPLRTWCRDRRWTGRAAVEGPLVGRTLTEGTLAIDLPAAAPPATGPRTAVEGVTREVPVPAPAVASSPLRAPRRWWMIPVVLGILVVGALAVGVIALAGTGVLAGVFYRFFGL